MKPRILFLVMSTVIVVFIVVFHLFGIINGYSKSTFNNPFLETLSYLVMAVVIFWCTNLVFGKQIKVMMEKIVRIKRKFKVLEHDIPEFRLSKNSFDYVSKKDFIKNEKSRIPLFIGTQFGIFPKDYIESQNFKNRKIAILGKSLLSGAQTGIRYFTLDESTLVKLKKDYCISTKLENHNDFEDEQSLHREMKNIRAKKQFENEREKIRIKSEKVIEEAYELYSDNELIKYCKEINLHPRPEGYASSNWLANCINTGKHTIMISTISNEWGCGYCKKKGGIKELREWYQIKKTTGNTV